MGKLDAIDSNKGVAVTFSFLGETYTEYIENLSVRDIKQQMSIDEVRSMLNQTPSRYAYWSSLVADITNELARHNESYDLWMAKTSHLESRDMPKTASGTARMQRVMVNHSEEYRKRRKVILQLTYARDKAKVIANTYDMQSRTLQSVLSSLRREIETLS